MFVPFYKSDKKPQQKAKGNKRTDSTTDSQIAATVIQTQWRGHATRNNDPKVIELKEEVEEYICIKKNSSKFKSNRKKEQTSTIKEIQTPSGLKIQIGSNNRQNELISLRKRKKGDLWFHAQETPGSHVVLKSSSGLFDEKDIQLAADLASFFSRARGNKLSPIIMVPIENLQRISGSLPGTVSHSGGKVLWGKAERAEKYFYQK